MDAAISLDVLWSEAQICAEWCIPFFLDYRPFHLALLLVRKSGLTRPPSSHATSMACEETIGFHGRQNRRRESNCTRGQVVPPADPPQALLDMCRTGSAKS